MAAPRRVVLSSVFALTVLQSFWVLHAKNVPGDFARHGEGNLPNPDVPNMDKKVLPGKQFQQPILRGGHANDDGQEQQQHRIKTKTAGGPLVKIAESTECRGDVKRFCGTSIQQNNFAIMDCLQNDVKDGEVTNECQHFLYSYKMNLTRDTRFESAAFEVCQTDLNRLTECNKLSPGRGEIIPCLMEHHENISAQHCKQFLIKMESIIFSDYRLVRPLVENCKVEITKTGCGRIGPNTAEEEEAEFHSHGAVIACLEENMDMLNGSCRFQIMRIAELQADDFHLDRALFYACRDDRERMCADIAAGGGRVYQCLFRHKFERDMSDDCRQRLIMRQKLIGEDYRADKTFSNACDDDIKTYNCLEGGPHHEFAKRSHILLCLEGVLKTDGKVSGQCIGELAEWRNSLMSDYQISPEIVLHCANEIQHHCNGLGPQGRTIHCLMKQARPDPKDKQRNPGLGQMCMRQMEELLKEADVGEDFRVDEALQEACQDAVAKYCGDIHPGDARVMGCLMEKLEPEILDSEHGECAEHLLEIQYFVARDFRLDHQVYKHCHRDAAQYCGAPAKWTADENTDVDPGPLVLPCLYRYMTRHHDAIRKDCRKEVRRVMAMRATSIDLMPEIEKECVQDLGQFCSEGVAKGEEMKCLQDKFDDLTDNCQDAVGNFTEMEDADIELDMILMRACMPMIKQFCQDMLDREDEEDIMTCLIENKNHQDMNQKCAVGIEHHQLTNLKEFRFNHKFKENCKNSVLLHCKGKTSKLDVVKCLSEIVRNDTLFESKHRVEKSCRKQLRFELLQRSENILLDPELSKTCEEDRAKFCDDIRAGKAKVLDCLKKHQKKLQKPCRKMLFSREEDEVMEGADYGLITACKKMIKTYCPDKKDHQILNCLKRHKGQDDFDERCHRVVIQRQITQNQDYRLNPQLQEACHADIPKFCSGLFKPKAKDEMMEGKVINCLKKQFKINRLSQKCEGYVRDIIRDAALDYRQDPVLAGACKETILKLCADAIPDAENNDVQQVGPVEECLKKNFNKITEKECITQVARIAYEGKIDVHVDPLLHSACIIDIRQKCNTVPGEGMIMSCLLSLLEDRAPMTPSCREKLQQRKEMWEYAAKVAPPETVAEVLESLSSSPSRNYFLGILLTIVGIIFITGISCGRVTKKRFMSTTPASVPLLGYGDRVPLYSV